VERYQPLTSQRGACHGVIAFGASKQKFRCTRGPLEQRTTLPLTREFAQREELLPVARHYRGKTRVETSELYATGFKARHYRRT
jgi:hypothetical protein